MIVLVVFKNVELVVLAKTVELVALAGRSELVALSENEVVVELVQRAEEAEDVVMKPVEKPVPVPEKEVLFCDIGEI